MERKFIKGIDASPGIAIGKVFLYQENELLITKESHKTIEEENNVLFWDKKRPRNNWKPSKKELC